METSKSKIEIELGGVDGAHRILIDGQEIPRVIEIRLICNGTDHRAAKVTLDILAVGGVKISGIAGIEKREIEP